MNEPHPEPGAKRRAKIVRSRTRLSLLVTVAFAPIVVAYVVFFHFPEYMPTGTTNAGELIRPPIRGEEVSEDFAQRQTWSLMQLGDAAACDEDCTKMLYLSRQVVIGLGKDAPRVSRLLLTTGTLSEPFRTLLSSEHRDVTVREVDVTRLRQIVGQIAGQTAGQMADQGPTLFLMDPNGNIMMYYKLDKAGKPLLDDLKHLLRISNIG